MGNIDLAVVGGGAAGLTAAISAARRGASVILLEKMPQLGKKILATGSGRCNLLNERLDSSFYNEEARALTEAVFSRFDKEAILRFFHELGLATASDEGRIFPLTDQALSVLEVLRVEIARLKVPCEFHCEIKQICRKAEGFELVSKQGKTFRAKKVILTGGGKSYPALGSDGNAYQLAQAFGHTLIEPVPSTVALVVKDSWCHLLQGLRMRAEVTALIGGKAARKASGEILFTKYGLSGTAILDVSEELSIALHRRHVTDLQVMVDFLPSIGEEELLRELKARREKGFPKENFLTGLLPEKLAALVKAPGTAGEVSKNLARNVPGSFFDENLLSVLKRRKFKVEGTRGWNEAEFTAGGISTREVDPATLESLKQKGLFFAGEVLDVQGCRGGYNLAWAWASGFVAGLSV